MESASDDGRSKGKTPSQDKLTGNKKNVKDKDNNVLRGRGRPGKPR